MGKTPQINVTCSNDRKERWENAVDSNPEYDSVADLVRTSVEKELAGGSSRSSTGEESPAVGGPDSESQEKLRQIKGGIDDLHERMGVIERAQQATAGFDLQKVVFELLPVLDDDLLRAREAAEKGVTADTLAEKTGAERDDITKTLSRLRDSTSLVKEVSGEDDIYWYRKD